MLGGDLRDPKPVMHYVTVVMGMIDDDIKAGKVPYEIIAFRDLHDYVDANAYLLQAGVPWKSDNMRITEFSNRIMDMVDCILYARAWAGWRDFRLLTQKQADSLSDRWESAADRLWQDGNNELSAEIRELAQTMEFWRS